MIELYDFQSRNITEIRGHFREGRRSVLWYLPTGGGKSTASAFMIEEAQKRGKRAWFIVHRRELLRQTRRLFDSLGIPYGLIASGEPRRPSAPVQIATIGTLARRIDSLVPPDMVILDEAHHVACESWSKLLARLGNPYIVGLSASPVRLDGRGLSDYFSALVAGPAPRELIASGYLSPFRTFAPPTVDTSGLHTRAGDYVRAESETLLDKPSITGSALSEYRRICDGKRAIVFCVSIQHSQHVAEQFRQAGYSALHVDGTTADTVRDGAIDDFERGRIQVLCNVDLCGEGLSINGIECVILLRPTQSLALFIQQVGRGLRRAPGKSELVILDHVGSTQRFGFIDETREWSLQGEERGHKKTAATSVKICPGCFCALSPRVSRCDQCGHTFEAAPRQVDEREGELKEITTEEAAEQIARRHARREQGRAQTLEQLLEIERRKGYRPGWAAHVFQARQAKRTQDRRSGA